MRLNAISVGRNLVTAATVDQFAEYVKKQSMQEKVLVLLNGSIGCGKTYFVQKICKKLEIDNVVSPTFLFYKEYQNTSHSIKIIHIDFYRNQTTQGEWEAILFEPVDNANIIFVEWYPFNKPFFKFFFNFKKISVEFQETMSIHPKVKILYES